MPVVYYSDKSDRQLKIEQERQAGRRLLSDDFVDVNGDPTDGTSGRLTTEVETPDSEVPKTITQAQFRVAVHRQGGSVAALKAAIDALPDSDTKTEGLVEWEYSALVRRNSPFLNQVVEAAGYTQTQLDNLFRVASRLPL